MPTTLAAIDIGSNAIRLSIGRVENDLKITVLDNVREPVRLGRDVFTKRVISEESIDAAVDAFKRFKEAIERSNVTFTRAVATSALREAMNRDSFIEKVARNAAVNIDIIGPEEEARLIHLAIAEKINLKNKTALLIDIGGGSTEVTLTVDGSIISTDSFRLGTVRLLQVLEEKKHGEKKFNQLAQEYVEATQKRLKKEIGGRKVDLCVGTGGNIEALADLRKDLLNKERNGQFSAGDLGIMVKKLISLSYEDRIQQLRLRPDRADVIVPASVILQEIVKVAGIEEVTVPGVGLKEGILIDMGQTFYGEQKYPKRDQVITSALEIGRKYSFDEQHGTSVARYAGELFDQTKDLHNLALEHRLLLEVAAMLHDIGSYISMTAHHKHTYYLLTATPIIGLSQNQMQIVANVARYHRKSFPKIQHESYKGLSSKDRIVVSKLAAILRLADAMDNEHASRVESFTVDYPRDPSDKKAKFTIRLHGNADLLLERWALMNKGEMFEDVFGVKVTVED